ENLHGHNFQVQCEIVAPVLDNGLTFDYGIIKKAVREICDQLDEKTVLPALSPHLNIEKQDKYTVATFNGERLYFLERDVMTLPVRNTTVEELSHYILENLLETPTMRERGLQEMTVKVSSSPGQTGCSSWYSNTTAK
ncbi:MAG: 6-carboxytetrahydropterin synthase, partial [Gammaproteobacteria bacterium]|nr:6-carboxytetrahydropterin synthase [Gammaproteobacteria bacterium]